MARKFWERVSGGRLRFYTDPRDFVRADVLAEITRLQDILALPNETKAIMAAGIPGLASEADFDRFFQDQIDELADVADYFGYARVQETIDTFDHGYMSPSAATLGAGTIVSVCGEESGNEAINAIGGTVGANWQHDVDHAHELVFDFGYDKRIDGIRFRNPASPGGPLILGGIDVFVSTRVKGLDNPNSHVGVGLSMTAPAAGDVDFDLTPRNGRYVKLTVASTGHGRNHITIRDIHLRVRARTFGL